MPPTVLELERLATHTIGGTLPTEVPAITVINEAGEFVCNLHPWKWLNRTTSLPFVANQRWLDLPPDFASVQALTLSDALNGCMLPSTGREVDELRAGPQIEGPSTFYWTLEYQGSSALTAPTPRIGLHKAPADNVVDAVNLRYRAGWYPLAGSGDKAVVPEWCSMLLRQVVVAVARGYVEEDEATIDERLALIAEGPVFRAARSRDAIAQPNIGQMRGGAVSSSGGWARPYNPDRSVGPPVSY